MQRTPSDLKENIPLIPEINEKKYTNKVQPMT